jgi:catechol 2,3-dioxygenase-like lactoylglutathione lyase family enzyme
MTPYLEHANMTVRNLDEAIRFLTTAIPEFTVRHRGMADGYEWAHVGTDQTYIAISEDPEAGHTHEAYDELGVNHIGFVVENADLVAKALNQAGFEEGIRVDPHPYRKRIYFYDQDGNEWEFVEYFTDEAALRNQY